MKRNLLLAIFTLFAVSFAFGQRTISGTVTSAEDGATLPGVSVVVKGTIIGATTDFDGEYTIEVPEGYNTLIFSFIGMRTKEVEIGSSSTLNVELKSDVLGLDEVVVTGQGAGISKRRLSTTVSSIDAEDIKAIPSVQLDQLIQSKLPNAQIKMSSGQPGTASIIRSRGPVSAITNTTPVIFIDGIRVDNLNSNPALGIATGGAQSSAIADIPMEDIERIEYIPGGAATTLYGADAANGVLQIFTKRGKAQSNYVNLETQMGAIVGTRDFLRWEQTADLIFRPGFLQNYRIGLGGSEGNTSYSFSGNLYQDNSFNEINETIRRNFRTTFATNITDKLRYSNSVAFSNMEFTRAYNANTSFSRFGNLEGGQFGNLDSLSQDELDDLDQQMTDEAEVTNIREVINRFQVANNVKYYFSKDLTASLDFGIDRRNSVQREIGTNQLLITKGFFPEGTTDQGYIDRAERNFTVLSGDLNLQHNATAGDFSFITTAGGQFFRESDIQHSISANSVVDGSISINNSADQNATDFYSVITSYGIYIAENMGYKDKFFLDLGLRFDGNSAFGEEIGLIALPKIGASYILSDASFFRSAISENAVSLLKLRANLGQSSIFPTAFAQQRTFSGPSYLGALAFEFDNPGDPELQSEIATTIELGMDLGLANNKVSLGFTYYNTTTNDALFTPPAIPSTGQEAQLRNVGVIQNEGVETYLQLNLISNQDHNLEIGASYNYNFNLVESTGGAPEFAVGGFQFLGSFVKEGQPLGYLRGTSVEVNDDGSFDIERNAYLGLTFAPHFGTFNVSYSYKGKLSILVNGDYQMGGQGVNVDDVLRFFGGVEDEDRFPEEVQGQGLSFFDLAGFWVEDANYLKIRNIALSYRFDDVFDGRVRSMEVGFSVLNALNFVSSSFDPDATGAGIATQGGFAGGGFGFGTESAPRMYLGTLRIGL